MWLGESKGARVSRASIGLMVVGSRGIVSGTGALRATIGGGPSAP
jgi:hypothetical protein